MLTKLKQQIQEMLATEARIAHRLRLTPNRISVIGIILALLAALAYAEWQSDKLYLLVVAAVLLLLSGFCDVLDGVVARFYQQATPFGGFLDSLLDRYADAAVFLGIIISGLCDVLWGSVAIIGSLLVSYSRARAEAAGTKMESVGLAERAERMIILFLATLAAFFGQPQTIMNCSIILLAILSNLTVLQRTYYAYKKLRK
jgi:archaetidylinositol phosphate synthase